MSSSLPRGGEGRSEALGGAKPLGTALLSRQDGCVFKILSALLFFPTYSQFLKLFCVPGRLCAFQAGLGKTVSWYVIPPTPVEPASDPAPPWPGSSLQLSPDLTGLFASDVLFSFPRSYPGDFLITESGSVPASLLRKFYNACS